MARNQSEKAVAMQRRVLHPNEGWLTLYLFIKDGTWQTKISSTSKQRFHDYASARKYFDEHPKEFWWNDDDTTVGINDHRDSESLNSGRNFFLDHPDSHGA